MLTRSLPWLLIALLLAVLLFNVARAVMSTFAPVTTLPALAGTTATPPNWNWFSEAETTPAPVGDDLPETRSGAQLVGIVLTERERLATITTGNAQRSVYREGDSLDGNIRIERIEPTRVVLREQGEQRQLVLARFDTGGQATGSTTSPSPFLPPLGASSNPSFGTRVSTSSSYGTVIEIDSVPDQLAASLPFQRGDRIVSVDGYNLDHVARDAALRAELAESASLPIEIERNGATMELSVDLSALPSDLRALLAEEPTP